MSSMAVEDDERPLERIEGGDELVGAGHLNERRTDGVLPLLAKLLERDLEHAPDSVVRLQRADDEHILEVFGR